MLRQLLLHDARHVGPHEPDHAVHRKRVQPDGNSNANLGTDHAWGGHHLVFGGSVHGGQSYGTFPMHILNGPDDAGNRGNWIPTTSLDQYAATMGGWFGVSNADLYRIFPNLGNFATPSLGFI